MEIPAEEIVPGDVLLVSAGERVAADARLFDTTSLEVDESALTGESLPVTKDVEPVAIDAPLADRTSMVYGGTAVTHGSGRCVVTATGPAQRVRRDRNADGVCEAASNAADPATGSACPADGRARRRDHRCRSER